MFKERQPSMDISRQRRTVSLAVILMVLACMLLYPINSPRGEVTATVVVGYPEPASGREVELPGSFEPYEQALLHAMVTGYVSRVRVDIGDRVARGAALVELDMPEMKPALGRAKADIVGAEAALRESQARAERDRITFERLSSLQASEPLAVTQQDVDMAEGNLQVSRAEVESAKAEILVAQAKLEELEARMAYAVIRAPFDGVVVQRFIDPGALVVSGADGGGPVLEVVREDRLRLVLAVPEPIVLQTRVGVSAEITVDVLPGRIFSGTVTRYAGPLTQDTRTMRTEIDMDGHGGLLRPGMYAKVRLQLGGDDEQLSVPASLIRHDGNGRAFVWTVRDGVAEKTHVEIARDDGASAVIEAGLLPESLIVFEAPAELREGQPVNITEITEEVQ